MQDYELTAYLGDTDTTPEQRDALTAALSQITETYPLEDDYMLEQQEAGSGAAQVILGDDTLDGLVAEWREQQTAERAARYRVHGAVIATLQAGESENAIAKTTGLSRSTVRKLAGK